MRPFLTVCIKTVTWFSIIVAAIAIARVLS